MGPLPQELQYAYAIPANDASLCRLLPNDGFARLTYFQTKAVPLTWPENPAHEEIRYVGNARSSSVNWSEPHCDRVSPAKRLRRPGRVTTYKSDTRRPCRAIASRAARLIPRNGTLIKPDLFSSDGLREAAALTSSNRITHFRHECSA